MELAQVLDTSKKYHVVSSPQPPQHRPPAQTNRDQSKFPESIILLAGSIGVWKLERIFFDSSEGGDFSSDTWPLSHGGGRGGLLSFKPGTTYTSVAHNLATILSRQLKKSQLYFNLDNQHNSTYLLVDDK